jgi:hypothetical protein
MRDERRFLRIALQRVEGGAIGGVQRERGEELPARLDLHASRERRAPRANPLGHLASIVASSVLSAAAAAASPGRIVRATLSSSTARRRSPARSSAAACSTWRATRGPRGSVDEAPGEGRRAARRRHRRAGRLGLLARRRAGAERERQQKSRRADRQRSAHLAGSTSDSRWNTFRFLAKSSSVISE